MTILFYNCLLRISPVLVDVRLSMNSGFEMRCCMRGSTATVACRWISSRCWLLMLGACKLGGIKLKDKQILWITLSEEAHKRVASQEKNQASCRSRQQVQRFRRPENNVHRLAPANIFHKKGRVRLFRVCVCSVKLKNKQIICISYKAHN